LRNIGNVNHQRFDFKEEEMPIVTLANAGNLDKKQKELLIKKLTDAVVEVTGKPAQAVYVRIDEVPRENFGVGGKMLG